MKRSMLGILVLGLFMSMLVTVSLKAEAATTQPAGVSGTWKWQMQGRNGAAGPEVVLKLKQEGNQVTGTITSGPNGQETNIEEGAVKGKEVSFNVVRENGGQKFITKYTLTIDGDTIKGKSEQVITRQVEGKRATE